MASFRALSLTALLAAVAAIGPAFPLAAQVVANPDQLTTVWPYNATCGQNGNDYPDVPARPFVVGSARQTVLWFAANSNGNFSSVGTGGVDILATLQRGTAAGAGCVPWTATPNYPNSTPQSYNTGLWLVAPFTLDGIHVQALAHNEFHGEWTGNTVYCQTQNSQTKIVLPCNYWNIVSASSPNGGLTFQLATQPSSANNLPAIALNAPYVNPSANPQFLGPQGMVAQSNILQFGSYYYVLAAQHPYSATGPYSPQQTGTCVYRAAVPSSPGDALVWRGWGGKAYDVAVPTTYPSATTTLCQTVLGTPFRFSWSISRVLTLGGQPLIIVLGEDTTGGMKNSGVSTANCPYATGASAATTDGAFVYTLAILDQTTGAINQFWPETCLLQTNSIGKWATSTGLTGQSYPSLLDPQSPQLGAGDRNFQNSGAAPYLYYTQLNPRPASGPANNRDLVRVPLSVSGDSLPKAK